MVRADSTESAATWLPSTPAIDDALTDMARCQGFLGLLALIATAAG